MAARSILSAVAVLSLGFFAAASPAATTVSFSLNNTLWDCWGGSNLMIENTNFETDYSSMRVDVHNPAPGGELVDSVWLDTNGVGGFMQSFLADLALTQNGPNDWSAAGTLSFKDNDPFSLAFDSVFTSTSMTLRGNSSTGYQFRVAGYLTPQSGQPTMLVGRGNPWVFAGNRSEAGLSDADSTALTVTTDAQPWAEVGSATFAVDLPGYWNLAGLDDLLGIGFYQGGGTAMGSAMVPEPLTLVTLAGIAALPIYLKRRRK